MDGRYELYELMSIKSLYISGLNQEFLSYNYDYANVMLITTMMPLHIRATPIRYILTIYINEIFSFLFSVHHSDRGERGYRAQRGQTS